MKDKMENYDESILYLHNETFVSCIESSFGMNIDFQLLFCDDNNNIYTGGNIYWILDIGDFTKISYSDAGEFVIDSIINKNSNHFSDGIIDKKGTIWLLSSKGFGKYQNGKYSFVDINTNFIETSDIPLPFALAAYPNPFNPATTIDFVLPEAGAMSLRVYDVTGRAVGTLKEGYLPAGKHAVVFDGERLASGVYFFRLEAKGYVRKGKMTLMK